MTIFAKFLPYKKAYLLLLISFLTFAQASSAATHTGTTYNTSALTTFTGFLPVQGYGGDYPNAGTAADTVVTDIVLDETGNNFSYSNLNANKVIWVYNEWSEPPILSTMGTQELIIAANGPVDKYLKFEIEHLDDSNNLSIAIGYLLLGNEKKNYVIDLSTYEINPSKIKKLVFVAEESPENRVGTTAAIDIDFNIVLNTITGTTHASGDLTTFTGLADQGVSQLDDPATANISSQEIGVAGNAFTYSGLASPNEIFAFNVWTDSPSLSTGTDLVVAASGPAGSSLKVELRDVNNAANTDEPKVVFLALGTSLQNYTIDLASLGLEATQMRSVVFLASADLIGASGTIDINFNIMPDLTTDDDQDGVVKGIEDFFGTSDTDSNSFPVLAPTVVGNKLTIDNLYMAYDPAGSDGIDGTIDDFPVFEISTDLITWTPVADGDITFNISSATSKIEIDIGSPAEPKLFIRANFGTQP